MVQFLTESCLKNNYIMLRVTYVTCFQLSSSSLIKCCKETPLIILESLSQMCQFKEIRPLITLFQVRSSIFHSFYDKICSLYVPDKHFPKQHLSSHCMFNVLFCFFVVFFLLIFIHVFVVSNANLRSQRTLCPFDVWRRVPELKHWCGLPDHIALNSLLRFQRRSHRVQIQQSDCRGSWVSFTVKRLCQLPASHSCA